MERLKQLREERGVYQKDVALYLGVDRTTYVKYERGDSQPNHEMLISLSKFFNVSVDYILGIKIDSQEISIARERVKALYDAGDHIISEVENALGANFATIRSWMNGFGDYFNDKIVLFADFFEVSTDFLLGRTNEMKPFQLSSNDNMCSLSLNPYETKVITAYRGKPEMQPAVDTLLGITSDEEYYIPVAARNGKSGMVKVTSSPEERKAALDKELPGVSTPKKPDVF